MHGSKDLPFEQRMRKILRPPCTINGDVFSMFGFVLAAHISLAQGISIAEVQ